MSDRVRRHKDKLGVAVILSVLLIFLAPIATSGAFFVDYLLSYDGTCGPHATDIPARPCTEAEYRAEFSQGFGGVGLFLIAFVSGVVATFAVGTGWLIWAVIHAARSRRSA